VVAAEVRVDHQYIIFISVYRPAQQQKIFLKHDRRILRCEAPDIVAITRGLEIADLHSLYRVPPTDAVPVEFKVQCQLQRNTPGIASKSQVGSVGVYEKGLTCYGVGGRRRTVKPVFIARPCLRAAEDPGLAARILQDTVLG